MINHRSVMGLEEIYQAIKKCKTSGGKYHKVLFHLHTPASYDYKFFPVPNFEDNDKYKNISFKDFLNHEDARTILRLIAGKLYKLPEEKVMALYNEGGYSKIFGSEEEYLAYLIISKQLLDSGVEMVVVMDHNTLSGIEKLKCAVKCLHKCGYKGTYTEVISGIEISCADKFHLAVIINPEIYLDNNPSYKLLTNWLNDNLYSKELGTFQTSFWVANDLKRIFGNDIITYIAHIYSGLAFNKDSEEQDEANSKLLSKAYQKVVFCRDTFDAVGIKEPYHKEKVSARLQDISNLSPCFKKFVLDNDAHDVYGITLRHFFIKSNKLNYQAIQEALLDYEIAVSFSSIEDKSSFIEGIFIRRRGESQGTDYQFLTGKNGSNENFVMPFSSSLNCIIGGRGTGKSTILMLLNLALQQKCHGWNDIHFAGLNGKIYVLFKCIGNEYLLSLEIPQVSERGNLIDNFVNQKNWKIHNYGERDSFNEEAAGRIILGRYMRMSERLSDGSWHTCDSDKREEILSGFIKRQGLIVDLLDKTMDSKEFIGFVFSVLFTSSEYQQVKEMSPREYNRFSLFKMLDKIEKNEADRANFINKRFQEFNAKYKEFMVLDYSAREYIPSFDEVADLLGYGYNLNQWYSDNEGVKYNFKIEDFIDHIQSLFAQFGLKEILKVLKAGRYEEFKMPKNIFYIHGLYGKTEIHQVNESIWYKFVRKAGNDILLNKVRLKQYILGSLSSIDRINLKFNVNNKESLRTEKDYYIDYDSLSMGQKSVALIDLLLEGGELIDDRSPILFDQPEDNLDGRYIYKNLTRQFRETKDRRQIIIATHNATIVTNTVADQVYVLESNGKHGWIMQQGYAADNKIKKYIISYLEGGEDSFKHKINIYASVLNGTEKA